MTFCFVIIEYVLETPFPNGFITLMHSYLQYIYTGSCNMNAFVSTVYIYTGSCNMNAFVSTVYIYTGSCNMNTFVSTVYIYIPVVVT